MAEVVFENYLKSGYFVEKGDDSLIITSSSCYIMKEETLFLIDNLPEEGSREYYVEAISSLGICKASEIFERLVCVGALRVKIQTPLVRIIFRNLIKPNIPLFSAISQQNLLNKFGITLSRKWLLSNFKLFFILSASGIVLSLAISFTSIFSWFAEISTGRAETMYIFTLVLLSSLIHELGHSFTSAICGIGFRPIGFSIYLIYPVFYTNVSGIERLSTFEKAAIDCGGFFSQSVYLFLLLLLWLFTKNMLFLESVRWISLIMAFNMNPFLRTDGYWLYKDVRKGLGNNKFAQGLHFLFIIAFSAFSLYLFSYIFSRMGSIYGLFLNAYHDPNLLLREGYKIILGFYLLIMFFVGSVYRFQETHKEWIELKNRWRA